MRVPRRHAGRACWALLTLATCCVGLVSVPGLNTSALATAHATTNSSDCQASNPPNELVLAGGTPQTAPLQTAFANPLQVTLANSNGCPVTAAVGTPITFIAPEHGASGRFEASGTRKQTVGVNPQGSAQAGAFTADDTPGSYTVIATSAYNTVAFELTNSAAGIPAKITALKPTTQTTHVNSRYAKPLSVRVTDANGTPVEGATVTFTLSPEGATSGPIADANFDTGAPEATASTGANGIATSPRLAANSVAGTLRAIVTVHGTSRSVRFMLRNAVATPVRSRPALPPPSRPQSAPPFPSHWRLRSPTRTATPFRMHTSPSQHREAARAAASMAAATSRSAPTRKASRSRRASPPITPQAATSSKRPPSTRAWLRSR